MYCDFSNADQSIIAIRERPLDSQGGAWVFFEKNILALVLAKKIFWP